MEFLTGTCDLSLPVPPYTNGSHTQRHRHGKRYEYAENDYSLPEPKRGQEHNHSRCGKSEGAFNTTGLFDLVDDARMALRWSQSPRG